MDYTLNDVWEQSISSSKCVCVSYKDEESYMYKGIKISKFDEVIKIYSTSNSQIKYTEINDNDYILFKKLGFFNAVIELVKSLYQEKIDVLNYRIKYELNTRNNKKHYDSLRIKRENLISKYSNISKL